MSRRLSVLLLIFLAAWPAWSAPAAPPEVYVNNRKLSGRVLQLGKELYVEAAPAITAMRGQAGLDAASGKPTANGTVLQATRLQGGVQYASLRELASVLGGRVQEQPVLGIVDVITFDPKKRAQVVASRTDSKPASAVVALVDGKRIADAAYMAEIYQVCETVLRVDLGMVITLRVIPKYVPLGEVRMMAGESVLGFAEYIDEIDAVHLVVPTGQRADVAAHTVAHELVHAWQMSQSTDFPRRIIGVKRLTEGFAEWSAAQVLKKLGFNEEVKRLEANLFEDYSEGYKYVSRMADRIGPMATVQHFRKLQFTR
jgi:hypothetical protein